MTHVNHVIDFTSIIAWHGESVKHVPKKNICTDKGGRQKNTHANNAGTDKGITTDSIDGDPDL